MVVSIVGACWNNLVLRTQNRRSVANLVVPTELVTQCTDYNHTLSIILPIGVSDLIHLNTAEKRKNYYQPRNNFCQFSVNYLVILVKLSIQSTTNNFLQMTSFNLWWCNKWNKYPMNNNPVIHKYQKWVFVLEYVRQCFLHVNVRHITMQEVAHIYLKQMR